ncbi:hypothetical protein PAXRUDRAFT_429621 [Paxillus rubicundulus Ve08.2h10]|uniref:Secreted protein n=1 Tax=Paxillus rubicundulus Ve08.2h10 TaxID=930991 RepID=A0A0D0CMD4_9AGAM|nr:hypothetical protein PAXRUDRAFT_429621 [Paxillus rubicundulus Ve08.2h10]
MKTFLTLLAAIISLSAYTLVGVHAKCAICPKTVAGAPLKSQCTQSGGDITRCQTGTKKRRGERLTGASMTKMEPAIVVVRLARAKVARARAVDVRAHARHTNIVENTVVSYYAFTQQRVNMFCLATIMCGIYHLWRTEPKSCVPSFAVNDSPGVKPWCRPVQGSNL